VLTWKSAATLNFPALRREFIGLCLAFSASAALPKLALTAPRDSQSAPPITALIRQPLPVRSLYRLPVSHDHAPDGAAGTNRQGYRWIEDNAKARNGSCAALAEGLQRRKIALAAAGCLV
jgi:hypothetical protein